MNGIFSNFDRSEILGRELYEKWVDAYNRESGENRKIFIPTPLNQKCVFDGILKSCQPVYDHISVIEIKVRSSEYPSYLLEKDKLNNIFEATSKPFYGISQLEEVYKDPITDIRRFYVNIIDQGNKVKYFIYNLNQIKELIDKGQIKEESGRFSKTTAVNSYKVNKAVYLLDTRYALTFTLDKNKGVFLK